MGKDEQRRVGELETRVAELEEEVATLRSRLPSPKPLPAGMYRGVVKEAEEYVAQSGARMVRIKIGDIGGFPENEAWTFFSTRRQPSPFENFCLEVGFGAPRIPDEEVIEEWRVKRLVGQKVEFSARPSTFGSRPHTEVSYVRGLR